MSTIQQTFAMLTVYYVPETNWFWKRFRSPMKSVAIKCHMASPVPNLIRPVACVMQRDPWTGKWSVTMELHQWRSENIGEKADIRPVNHTDEEYIKIWERIRGNSEFRGTKLTEERVIGWLLGIEPWTKTTWKALNFE